MLFVFDSLSALNSRLLFCHWQQLWVGLFDILFNLVLSFDLRWSFCLLKVACSPAKSHPAPGLTWCSVWVHPYGKSNWWKMSGFVYAWYAGFVFPFTRSLSDRREALFNFGFSQGWRCIYSLIQRGKCPVFLWANHIMPLLPVVLTAKCQLIKLSNLFNELRTNLYFCIDVYLHPVLVYW